MFGRTRLLAIFAGAAVIALIAAVAIILLRGHETGPPGPLVTPGRWPAQERTDFIDSCVKSCRAAPGVTPAQYPVCDRACKCGADEAEKIVAAEDLVDIYKEMQNGKPTREQSDKLERMKAAGLACAAQGAR